MVETVKKVGASAVQGAAKVLTQGDSGSTLLGTVAAASLLSGVNFEKVLNGDKTSLGLLAGSALVGVWGYFVGKGKKPSKGKGK